jgi:hypothetical protein
MCDGEPDCGGMDTIHAPQPGCRARVAREHWIETSGLNGQLLRPDGEVMDKEEV